LSSGARDGQFFDEERGILGSAEPFGLRPMDKHDRVAVRASRVEAV